MDVGVGVEVLEKKIQVNFSSQLLIFILNRDSLEKMLSWEFP